MQNKTLKRDASGAVINTDKTALETYRSRRTAAKESKAAVNEVREFKVLLASMGEDIQQVKETLHVILAELRGKNG
jgi:hypothetical protein